MKIEYDAQVDIMYIELRDADVEDAASRIIVDFDKNGLPVGTEILDASSRLGGIPKNVQLAVADRKRRRRVAPRTS